MEKITISAKNLGAIASPEFCPRCFWIKLHCTLPYQIFPGIFSSLDSYNKKIIHSYLDKNSHLPDWLSDVKDVCDYENPPHWSKFKIYDEKTGITLRGEADAIFKCKDGSFIIGDYKTAKFTGTQDKLFPIYDIQLNGYAYIGEQNGFSPISRLVLIYFEPNTDDERAARDETISPEGFLMEFSPHILDVKMDPEVKIPPLLKKTREIYDLDQIPEGLDSCKNCQKLENLIKICNL